MSDALVSRRAPLPVGSAGYRGSGWWGACFLVLSEASIFAYLFFVYFYFSIQPQAEWVPGRLPDFTYSAPQSAVILIGCATAWWASRSVSRGAILQALLALVATVVLGAGFIALQLIEWSSKPFTFSGSAYSSIFFTIGGFHLAHVVVGWIMFVCLSVWTALGYFDAIRHLPITIGALYWYFLAIVWLAVFFVLYGTPYLT
ncbi:MAG TPA: cytochrome c oxidase subunit 3 [Stellaceae bacterium]